MCVYIQSFKKLNPFLSFILPVLEYKCLKQEQPTVLQHILNFSSCFYIATICVYSYPIKLLNQFTEIHKTCY
jgi:hypothetical protein